MDERENEKVEKLGLYMQIGMLLAVIVVLGSCVSEIDDVGGGHDSNQKMAGIFFFHLFLIVPCISGIYVFLQVKLEKLLLNKETIESLNAAHMKHVDKEMNRVFGVFSPFFGNLLKRKKK